MVTRILALIVLIVGTATTTQCGLSDSGAQAHVGSTVGQPTAADGIDVVCCACHHRYESEDCEESSQSWGDYWSNDYWYVAHDKRTGCPGQWKYVVNQQNPTCVSLYNPNIINHVLKGQDSSGPDGGTVNSCADAKGGITYFDGTICQ